MIESIQHQKFVRRSYLCFTLSFAIAFMGFCAVLYVLLTGLQWNARLHEQSVLLQLGFIGALIAPIPIAFSIGGWTWLRIGKRFLGITREDMEALLLSGSFRVAYLDRANRRAIDKLFDDGKNKNGMG